MGEGARGLGDWGAREIQGKRYFRGGGQMPCSGEPGRSTIEARGWPGGTPSLPFRPPILIGAFFKSVLIMKTVFVIDETDCTVRGNLMSCAVAETDIGGIGKSR